MQVEAHLPCFLVDQMLLKLCLYLRCLGYDAAERPGEGGVVLIARAGAEGRVLLTRNLRLPRLAAGRARVLVVRSKDPVEQLWQVTEECALDVESHAFTRCIRCNVLLEEAHKTETLRARVPEGVWAGFREFWTCPGCGTVFWKGSHVRNTCLKLGLPDVSHRHGVLDPW
jgi:uncharacterized protein with PIN domain